jgi:hypothetical protein
MRLVQRARTSMLRVQRGGQYAKPLSTPPLLRQTTGRKTRLEEELAPRQGAAEVVERILDSRFFFLNECLHLPDPIDWRLARHPQASRLWRFHLHSHEFLLDFAACGRSDPAIRQSAWRLVEQWIAGNPPSDPRVYNDAWHPFCISRRLPAWFLLWQVGPPPEKASGRILESMFLQARFLADHLEWDLGGNHLLENAKALALAGAFFEGPEAQRWLEASQRIFQRELPEQILPHGEHFERSPMYHAQILAALVNLPELSTLCGVTALHMAEFLQTILHPDGDIPLFGDSCLGTSPTPAQLIGRAVGRPVQVSSPPRTSPQGRQIGDYWIWRDGGEYLIFDAGPVGADHLPAHAHADLLTFEASLACRRLFVDTGVFNYEDDAMRQHCRGTAAHNVLQVEDENQCDVWSRFRMGRRGKPLGLTSGETDGFHWAQSAHNAYRYLDVHEIVRWIACRSGGPWICLDAALGRGTRRLTQRLHLAPGTRVEHVGPETVQLHHAGMRCELTFFTPGELRIATGWYCPSFGVRIPSPVLQWTTCALLPAVVGWFLQWNGEGRAWLEGAGASLKLVWEEQNRRTEFIPFPVQGTE